MFQGTIRKEMRAMFHDMCSGWESTDVYNPCAGIFTINQIIQSTGIKMSHHACDVLMFSSAVGWYLSGQPVAVEMSDDARDEIPFIERTMQTDIDKIATILLLSENGEHVGKTSAYSQRLMRGIESQWDTMHRKTVDRVRRYPTKLTSYDAEDAFTWIERIPPDAAVASSPPFGLRPNGFANQYRHLDRLFDWDEPKYKQFTEKSLTWMIERLVDRRDFVIGFDEMIPSISDYLRGTIEWPGRKVKGYVYASNPNFRISIPKTITTGVSIPKLAAGEDIGEKVELVEISAPQFRQLRAMYYNPSLRGAPFDVAVAVLVDGKLIGAMAVREGWKATSIPPDVIRKIEAPYVFGVNGFGITGTDYDRISQLPVYCLLSTEFQEFLERKYRSRIRSYVTESFSDHPEVKRYRGTLQLLKRGPNRFMENHRDNPSYQSLTSYYERPWQLWYGSPTGKWTLQEGFEKWRKKHGTKKPRKSQPESSE